MESLPLTIDLGNSALKIVRWGGAAQIDRVDWGGPWESRLDEALASTAVQGPVLIASVTTPERLARVQEHCARAGKEAITNPECDLRLQCREPHTIGRDRLLAALGAWGLEPRAALVIDAGTALTVDALGEDAGHGVFLGGAIAPGPELLARALGSGAANLFEVQTTGGVPALGKDTPGALAAGVSHGFVGTVRELALRVAREAELSSAPVWLTGGAAPLLSEPGLFGERKVHHEPRLVHIGLARALGLEVGP